MKDESDFDDEEFADDFDPAGSDFNEPSPWAAYEEARDRERLDECWLEPSPWDEHERERDSSRKASIARWAAIIEEMRAEGKAKFAAAAEAVATVASAFQGLAEVAKAAASVIVDFAATLALAIIQGDRCRRRRGWRIAMWKYRRGGVARRREYRRRG